MTFARPAAVRGPSAVFPAQRRSRSASARCGRPGPSGWPAEFGRSAARLSAAAAGTGAAGPARPVTSEQVAELAAQMRRLAGDCRQAAGALELPPEALDTAGLAPDDARRHLNFGRRPVCVNINRRYVAWCCRQRQTGVFGLILDSQAAAERAEASLQGAWVAHFTRRRTADMPTLHVPPAQLSRIPSEAMDSWRRAIRLEVCRRRRDGQPFTCSCRRHTRPGLYSILRESRLREEVLRQAFP